jgi:hypothetical protein
LDATGEDYFDVAGAGLIVYKTEPMCDPLYLTAFDTALTEMSAWIASQGSFALGRNTVGAAQGTQGRA